MTIHCRQSTIKESFIKGLYIDEGCWVYWYMHLYFLSCLLRNFYKVFRGQEQNRCTFIVNSKVLRGGFSYRGGGFFNRPSGVFIRGRDLLFRFAINSCFLLDGLCTICAINGSKIGLRLFFFKNLSL